MDKSVVVEADLHLFLDNNNSKDIGLIVQMKIMIVCIAVMKTNAESEVAYNVSCVMFICVLILVLSCFIFSSSYCKYIQRILNLSFPVRIQQILKHRHISIRQFSGVRAIKG